MTDRFLHLRNRQTARAKVLARGPARMLRASDIILGLMLALFLVVLAVLVLTSLFAQA